MLIVAAASLLASEDPCGGVQTATVPSSPEATSLLQMAPAGPNAYTHDQSGPAPQQPSPLSPPAPWTLRNITVGLDPSAFAVAPGGLVYCLNYESNNVTVLQEGNYLATVGVGVHPDFALYDGVDGLVYVLDWGSVGINSTVDVLNGTSVVASLTVGTGAISAVEDPTDGYVYVVNTASQNVSVLDRTRVVDTLAVGTEPLTSVYDPRDGYVYVTNLTEVFVFAGVTLVDVIGVGIDPVAAAYDPLDGFVYLADEGSAEVTVLNGTEVQATVLVGINPTDIVFDASDGYLDVVNSGSASVSVLDNETFLANVSAGVQPTAALFDPANGFVYVVDGYSDTLTVLCGTSSTIELTIDGGPSAAAYNPSDQRVYLADSTSDNVTVVQSNDSVTFEETGLPNRTPWGVALGNLSERTSGTSVTFVEGDGSYRFAFDPVPGYATNASGNVTVAAGVDVHRFVRFHPIEYDVRFVEQGLPSGTSWTIQLGASVNTTASTVNEFEMPNGSYRYQVGFLPGYTTNWSGSVTVNGSGVRVAIHFEFQEFPVTFVETGLPVPTNWSVTVGTQVRSSTSSSIGFAFPNGTYAFTLAPVPGYSTRGPGSFTVAGSPATVPIRFTLLTYHVRFVESGLPNATKWGITLASASNSSVTDALEFHKPNGTFSYSVAPVPGFVTGWSGSVRVAGTSVVISTPFVPFETPVEFIEEGLPNGTVWSVTLGVGAQSSSGPSIEFNVPNGSYAYRIGPIHGFVAPATFPLDIAGRALSVVVDFVPSQGGGPLNLPDWVYGAPFLGGVGALTLALAALVVWTRGRRRARSLDRVPAETEAPPRSA